LLALLLRPTPAVEARDERAALETAAERGDAAAVRQALNAVLFRAGRDADVVRAKRIADQARARGEHSGRTADAAMFRTVDLCFAAGEPRLPASDEPSPETRARYGPALCLPFRPAEPAGDFSAFRDCLLSNANRDGNRVAELYANGWGVKRDLRLAIALVCHASSVPAELEGMVATLDSMRSGAGGSEPFTFCAHVTSARGWCVEEWRKKEDARRGRNVDELTSAFTRDQRSALQDLVRAAEDFFRSASRVSEAQTPHYLDIALRDELARKDRLFARVWELESGPPRVDTTFEAADRELRSEWAKLLDRDDVFEPGGFIELDRNRLREAQRLWIPFRDAWAAYGKARYPPTSPDLWKAWITSERVEELRAYGRKDSP
jgi:hypothetical protein